MTIIRNFKESEVTRADRVAVFSFDAEARIKELKAWLEAVPESAPASAVLYARFQLAELEKWKFRESRVPSAEA